MRRIKFRPPSPAMVVALVALSVAMGGTGYAANDLIRSAATPKRHKHRKAPPLSAAQKAAVVALIRQFAPKAVNGAPGQNGQPGAPGSLVLTRARSTAPTTTITATTNAQVPGCFGAMNCPDIAHGAVVPVTGQAWTQAPNQLDQLFVQFTITPPNSSTCTYYTTFPVTATPPGIMAGEVDDATTGTVLASFSSTANSAPVTSTTLTNGATLFEPSGPVGHSLIVKIADNCGAGGNGAVGGGHFTLNNFALDPVGVS